MRIAITGGIAEGKSTVMGYLRDLGEKTASSDEIAREVFQQDEVQEEIARLLGTPLPLDTAVVRDRIAAEPSLRRKINRLTHPRILRRLETSSAKWIEVPLLFETCLQAAFNRVWVVTCGPEIQIQRLVDRLKNESLARQILATQLPSKVKLPFADEVIRTNLPEGLVQRDVRSAVQREIGK
jgi:dephospho-CoA kinase